MLRQHNRRSPTTCTTHFVYFATGSHALTPEDQDHIRDVAAMMQSTPSFVATIVGKTDLVGSADFNEHLSQRRAEAVFEALVYTNKVPENRVQLHWTGERLPFISAADEEAESQNRMAAIIVSNAASDRCGETAVEAGAKAMLKAMTEYVTAQKAISFDYDVNLEVVTKDDQKLTLAASGNVELARPDKIRASRSGGFADIETVFDGKTSVRCGAATWDMSHFSILPGPGAEFSLICGATPGNSVRYRLAVHAVPRSNRAVSHVSAACSSVSSLPESAATCRLSRTRAMALAHCPARAGHPRTR